MRTIQIDERYTVSEDGTVHRIARTVSRSDGSTRELRRKELSSTDDGYGYKQIRLCNDEGKRVSHKLHRLVAETFLPNPEGKRTVNHKDGNKHNNCVSNLEWATDGENECHAYETGLKDCFSFLVNGKKYSRFGLIKLDHPEVDKSTFYRKLKKSNPFHYKGLNIFQI